tara:strand:- start:62 stop:268 length:207 start_codon:yes stop_codon:yes gene_type:complete
MMKLHGFLDKKLDYLFELNKDYFIQNIVSPDIKRRIEKEMTMMGSTQDQAAKKYFSDYMMDQAERMLV